MIKYLFTTIFLTLLSWAFAQDSLLIEALKENTFMVNIDNDRFTGEVAKVLRSAIPENQFLLVGEQHGIIEIGQFTKVLFLEATNHDFQYLCVETDPFMAAKLEELAKGGIGGLESFCEELPFSFPFYENPDDFEFLSKVVQRSTADGTVI